MDEKCRKALQCLSENGNGTSANGSCRIRDEGAAEVELLDAYSRAVIAVVDAVGPAVVRVAVPVTPDVVAEMVVVPTPIAVATPWEPAALLMVPTAVFDEAQDTVVVTSTISPSV